MRLTGAAEAEMIRYKNTNNFILAPAENITTKKKDFLLLKKFHFLRKHTNDIAKT